MVKKSNATGMGGRERAEAIADRLGNNLVTGVSREKDLRGSVRMEVSMQGQDGHWEL